MRTKIKIELYNSKETCNFLDIGRPTFWESQRAGILPTARRLCSITVGWTEQDLLDYIVSCTRG